MRLDSISSHSITKVGTLSAGIRHRAARQELPWVFEYSGLWPHPVSLLDTLSSAEYAAGLPRLLSRL